MKKLPFALVLVATAVLACQAVSCSSRHVTRAVAGSAVQSVAQAAVASAGDPASVADTPPGDERSRAAQAPDEKTYWPADGRFPGRGHVSGWSEFPRHNAQRRAQFAAYKVMDYDAIVFVGDSITEGWTTLVQDFSDLGLKVANRGIGGDTTPNLLYRLDEDVLSLRPRGLVILIGTNDLGGGTPPADIAANLDDVRQRIRAWYPEIPIALCLVMPRGDGAQYPQMIRALNDLIRQLAAKDPRITVCDTYTPLLGPDGKDNPKYFNPDHLHLNAAGYGVWRAAVHPIVAQWKSTAGK